jgi:hypothetical protein
MPKIKIVQSNFSSGELAPSALGRVDIARYPNAARKLLNIIPQTLGGAKKRPGMEWVAATKDSTKRSRLVPYVIGRDAAYMLEMGDGYMRVFLPDGSPVMAGLVPYEIASPYDEQELADIDYAQAEDAMYTFHHDITPHRIITSGDDAWNFLPVPFTTTPFSEQGDYPAVGLTLSTNTVGTGRTMTASASYWLAADVGRAILHNAGVAVITAISSDTVATVEVKSVFDSTSIASGEWNLDSSPQARLTPSAKDPVGASCNLTLSIAGWRSGDVGKFVRVNSGLVKIESISSTTLAVGEIMAAMTAAVAAPALSWTLQSSMWTPDNGYPCTGTMHDQRLITAGTRANPQTVFGSRIGEPLDFLIGSGDAEGYIFSISSVQTNQITYVIPNRNLLVLTHGGEFSMFSGTEKPIAPTNVQVKPQSPHGSRRVKPVPIGKEVLFVQRAGRKLRSIGYRYDEDGYKSADLTTLAEHITETGIACMAFQQEPDPVVWIALNSGRLVSVTFDRDLDVIAWAQHDTDGAVESLASMPYGDGEQVWMIVRREIGGTVKRYVERLQPEWFPLYGTEYPDTDAIPPEAEPDKWGFTLDCAVTQDDATGKAVWDGLDHLEGKTVRCIADGVDMPPMVVTGGEIELPRAAQRILVGLMFAPRIELLPPEVQGATGSIQGDAMSVHEVILRVLNTTGITVGGSEVITGRVNGTAQLDYPPQLVTGDVSATTLGWSRGDPEVVIEQAHPLPFHVLAVIRTMTINGG